MDFGYIKMQIILVKTINKRQNPKRKKNRRRRGICVVGLTNKSEVSIIDQNKKNKKET